MYQWKPARNDLRDQRKAREIIGCLLSMGITLDEASHRLKRAGVAPRLRSPTRRDGENADRAARR